MNKPIRGLEALMQMISVRRPSGSKSEKDWIRTWLKPLGLDQDARGNLYIRIGDVPVMWSSHTDTVHRTEGTQLVVMSNNLISLAKGGGSNCLGADDTAGVWLMREMILDSVPGLYVFHRAEEIGGYGSAFIARHTPELLTGINHAIALDRRGTGDVITYQGSRCCSDEFAKALAKALGGDYFPDDGGIFTDTANYTGLVPECTNLSVGYEGAHTSKEVLSWTHLEWLLGRLKSLDTAALPVVRKAGEIDTTYPLPWRSDYYDDDPAGINSYAHLHMWDEPATSSSTMVELVRHNPEAVADLLEQFGVSTQDVAEVIMGYYGYVKS